MDSRGQIPKKATKKIRHEEVAGTSGASSTREESVAKRLGDWSNLPDLVLDRVFTYLPRSDQASASQVCKNWSRAFDSPNLWRKIIVHMSNITVECLLTIVKFAERNKEYLGILDKFKHLENVEIDGCCVSNEVLRRLAQNCGESLKSLAINYIGLVDEVDQMIDNEVWRKLRKDCPNVHLDIRIIDFDDLEMMKRVLPVHVPLRRLKFETSHKLDEDDMNSANFITHVVNNWQNTLEDLCLDFPYARTMVDKMIKPLLPSLKKLTCLEVIGNISDAFVQEVEAMQERGEMNRLTKFHVTYNMHTKNFYRR